MKIKAFTLIEMLVAVAVLGIVLPLIFSAINGSFKELVKIESIQLRNSTETRLLNRLEEDFRTLTRFKYLKPDSISFFTVREDEFQEQVTFRIENNSINYQINDTGKKLLVPNVNLENTTFQFLDYDGNRVDPNGDEFSLMEMNIMSKIKLKYEFSIKNQKVINEFIKLRRMN